MSHAALFGRVGSKAELLMRALAPGPPQAARWFGEPAPTEGAHARLLEILADLMRFFAEVVPNLIVLRTSGVVVGSEKRHEPPPPITMRHALAAWLDDAQKRGCLALATRSDVLAEALLGAMEARCFNRYVGGRRFAAGSDREFLRALVDGLLGVDE